MIPAFDSLLAKAQSGSTNALRNRRIIVAVKLVLVQIVMTLGYFVFLTVITGGFPRSYFLPFMFLTAVVTLVLLMRGNFEWGRVVNLAVLNVLLFFASQRLGLATGISFYYVPLSCAALLLFGYEDWKWGITFTFASMLLFILSRFVTLSFVPLRPLLESQEQEMFVVNSVMTTLLSTYCVVMIMKLNFDSEKGLLEKQEVIVSQNEELRKANQELDSFVYSASHDLKSPLSSIKGLVNLMHMGISEDEKKEYLAKIKDRADAMERFLKELTMYSRNSRMEVRMEFALLRPLVDEVLGSMGAEQHDQSVHFRIEVPSDFVVRADLYRLKVALMNLITNAVKYADQGKEKKEVIIRGFQNGTYCIEVEDNGIGIQSEHLPKIFNMFYRATERSNGSGLGLYIASESITKMNGKITATSEVGVGTKFLVTLPKKPS